MDGIFADTSLIIGIHNIIISIYYIIFVNERMTINRHLSTRKVAYIFCCLEMPSLKICVQTVRNDKVRHKALYPLDMRKQLSLPCTFL